MIATLNAFIFVLSEKHEIISSKIPQKGQAVSKINTNDHQMYNYTIFVPLPSSDNNESKETEDEDENEVLETFQTGSVYHVDGKFTPNSDGSLDLIITSNRPLKLDSKEIPATRPFVHLLGHIEHVPIKTQDNYQVAIQVKPYINKEQNDTFSVILVHPTNGRFKNTFEKTRKFSLIHAIGVLIIYEKTLYCQISEYQFVRTKTDECSNNNISVPWKTTNNENTNELEVSTPKSQIEKRIAAVHQNIHQPSPPPTKTSKNRAMNSSKKGKQKAVNPEDLTMNLLNKQKTENQENTNDEEEPLSPLPTTSKKRTSSSSKKGKKKTPKTEDIALNLLNKRKMQEMEEISNDEEEDVSSPPATTSKKRAANSSKKSEKTSNTENLPFNKLYKRNSEEIQDDISNDEQEGSSKENPIDLDNISSQDEQEEHEFPSPLKRALRSASKQK